MNSLVILLGVVTGLVLAAIVLSFMVLLHMQSLARSGHARAGEMEQRIQAALKTAEADIRTLGNELHELELQPALNGSPPVPRAAFNLGKRTQALRMHRQGDSAEKIAASLELPRQEVELLLKVHRIVLSKVF